MKNLILILLVSAMNMYASSSYSQQTKLSLELESSELKDVLREIRQQTDFTVLYKSSDVKDVTGINKKFEDATVMEILDACLKGTELGYEIKDKVIVIHPVEYKEPAKPIIEQKQEKKEIKGTVTDSDGNTLPGVSVVVKGTTTGVATDNNGKYTIELEGSNVVLVFSFVGMTPQEIAYNGQTIQDITLEADSEQMAEVVVTGYQTLSRERATGSFSTIKREELDTRISTNIVDRLEGLTPGLSLDKDNNIMIRGVSTMYGNSNPLIVVDGFPIDGDLNTVNPEDIESLTVLKDAAAASVWGTRAANGVIVITTKQGSKNKGIEVNASYYKTIELKPRYSDLHYMNTSDRIDMELDFFKNYESSYTDSFLGSENTRFSALNELYRRRYSDIVPDDMRINEADYQKQVDNLRNVNGYKQYEDNLLQNAIKDQVNISLSSNSDNNSFVGSFAYNKDNYVSIGDESTRLVVNLNNSLKINDRVEFNVAANIVYTEQDNNGLGTSFFSQYYPSMAPYEKIIGDDGERVQTYNMNFLFKDAHEEMGLDYGYNPIDEMENKDNTTTGLSTRLQAGIGVKITDDIKFSSKYQYERNYSNTENHMTINNPKWRKTLNDYYIDGEYKLPYGGKLDRYGSETNSWTLRNQLDFTKSFDGDKHQITAIAGNEVRSYSYASNSSQIIGYDPQVGSGLSYDIYGFQNYDPRTRYGYVSFWDATFPDINMTENRDVSYYTNLSYLFLNKYNISGSYRLDQANIFGFDKSAKNNELWSIGTSWNIKEESFVNADWIDRLILRGTYGVNGNRPNPNITAYLTGVVNGPDFFYGPVDQKRISLTNPENAELRSEKVYTTNIGVDYSFFGGRVRGALEYYNKLSKDLIGPKSLNPTNGWEASVINYAEMRNRGVELGINVIPVKTKDFVWNIGFNFSYNQNEITDVRVKATTGINLEKPVNSSFDSRAGLPVKGRPIGRIYAYRWAGLDTEGLPQIENGAGEVVSYKDAVWGDDLMEYQGTSIAPYYGSISNNFKYKNFNLGVNFTYKLGHKMRAPVSAGLYEATGNYTPIHESYANYWKNPGDEKLTDVPAMRSYDAFESFYYQPYYVNADINVMSASQIRLRDVNLDYEIPKSLLKKIGIQSATLRFQAKNLWYWAANDMNLDPEAYDTTDGYWGSSNASRFPLPKSFTLGLKVNF